MKFDVGQDHIAVETGQIPHDLQYQQPPLVKVSLFLDGGGGLPLLDRHGAQVHPNHITRASSLATHEFCDGASLARNVVVDLEGAFFQREVQQLAITLYQRLENLVFTVEANGVRKGRKRLHIAPALLLPLIIPELVCFQAGRNMLHGDVDMRDHQAPPPLPL